jgi:hypothetical protein
MDFRFLLLVEELGKIDFERKSIYHGINISFPWDLLRQKIEG